MKLCLVGKYPPIQGGVSSQTFWFAQQVAALGHDVHIVTNAEEVEPSYRMYLSDTDCLRLQRDSCDSGSITVHQTYEPRAVSFIPYANPFVSKLAALAAEVVDCYSCDLILGWYLEPYGFAAALAAEWTCVPYAVRHAGSDIGRLAQLPERARAYRELLRRADLVLTGAPIVRTMLSAGIDLAKIYVGATGAWPTEFTPAGPALGIEELLGRLKGTAFENPLPSNSFDPQLPTIGMYGKIGTVKGTPALIDALALLARDGCEFNVTFMCGSHGSGPDELSGYIRRRGLENRAVMLPFLAPWRVPEYLRACTAVAVLENRFPIAIHQPTTAQEVMSTATCLVVSEEIRTKQPNAAQLVDGRNIIAVADPEDRSELSEALRSVIDDPMSAEALGRRGADTFAVEQARQPVTAPARLAERLSAIAEQKDASMSLRAFQEVVAKLYTNPAFRRAIQASADAAESDDLLGGRDLSCTEKAAIVELAALRRELDTFDEELHHKVFDFAWQHFPTVHAHFESIRDDAFRLFGQRYDFVDRGWLANIDYVASVVRDAAGATGAAACCIDAVDYDMAILWASTVALPDDELAGLAGTSVHSASNRQATNGRYIVNPLVRIITFEHDIPALIRGVSANDVPRRKVTIAFVPTRATGDPVAFVLALGSQHIVHAAASAATIPDIVRHTATHTGAAASADFHDACVRTVHLLHGHGVLIAAPAS